MTAFRRENIFARKLDINVRKKLVQFFIWSTTLCGAETWILMKVDQKYQESF
jgi:hypothetical protein